jgi:hypothetical protein
MARKTLLTGIVVLCILYPVLLRRSSADDGPFFDKSISASPGAWTRIIHNVCHCLLASSAELPTYARHCLHASSGTLKIFLRLMNNPTGQRRRKKAIRPTNGEPCLPELPVALSR